MALYYLECVEPEHHSNGLGPLFRRSAIPKFDNLPRVGYRAGCRADKVKVR